MTATMRLQLSILLICCVQLSITSYSLPHGGKIWALLVAGSNTYSNYRHQADVCHAYHVLHDNGIPDENIIVMMADDIAYNEANPTPGIIVNEPNGTDVYAGVPKDYTGENINATIFMSVLKGDSNAVKGIGTGRVIDSGPHDYIFVNFADHGAPGLLAMPHDVLFATQLLNTLIEMSAASRFAKAVLFIEACESGSMFDSILPDDTNIFALTAADPAESSFACYYDRLRQAYLGDLFSVMWMQAAEKEDLSRTTLHHLFEIVRTRTNTSHVEEYGDLNLGSSLLRDFIGIGHPYVRGSKYNSVRHPGVDVVSSRDVPVEIMKRKIEAEVDEKKLKKLRNDYFQLKKERTYIEDTIKSIVKRLSGEISILTDRIIYQKEKLYNFPCYEDAVTTFNTTCMNIAENDHSLGFLYMFVNLCENGFVSEKIRDAIQAECDHGENAV